MSNSIIKIQINSKTGLSVLKYFRGKRCISINCISLNLNNSLSNILIFK